MSRKPTIARYTLGEVEAHRERGKDPTRADTPGAESPGAEFWKSARAVMPSGKTSVHLRLDSGVVKWFKVHGRGHLTRMNTVLRAYVETQQRCT